MRCGTCSTQGCAAASAADDRDRTTAGRQRARRAYLLGRARKHQGSSAFGIEDVWVHEARIKITDPERAMLVEMRQRGIPVVVGADAHDPDRVADGFDSALALLESCAYTHLSFFLERTRREIPLPEAQRSLLADRDTVIARPASA